MFIQRKNFTILCTKCNRTGVMSLKDYETMLHDGDPEWFWEPYDYEEMHIYICPNCKDRDFISDSEWEMEDCKE